MLRAGKLAEADLAHIAEEIESMGRTEKRELVRRLTVLLLHLRNGASSPNLRQPELASQRRGAAPSGREPSRRQPEPEERLGAAIAEAYRVALLAAQRETGLDADVFPATCPWPFDEIVDDAFWPD